MGINGSMLRGLLAVLSVFAYSASDVWANEAGTWNPAKTRVFLVVLAEFQGNHLHSFSKDERLDDRLVEIFKERGVPIDQILLLKDKQATTLAVQTGFTNFLNKSTAGETLFFLFSSHGGYDPKSDKYSFYTFDNKLPFTWAFDTIEQHFKGSHVILSADCCFSGGITDVVAKRKTPISYACLSSTYDHQTAWSGWRFIQCLNRGLAGNPVVDLDGNQEVTLEELAAYTANYMSFAAEGKPLFKVTGTFNSKLRLSDASTQRHARVGELIEATAGHGWAKAEILDSKSNSFKVHFTKDTRPTNDTWVSSTALRQYQYRTYPVGAAVDIQDSSGDWHTGKVLQRWESLHWCRYDSPTFVPDEWFGPSRVRSAVAGNWAGQYENDLGESGAEVLTLQQEGDVLHGAWSGVQLKGERIGIDAMFLEGQTSNRTYLIAGLLNAEHLTLDYAAHRTNGEQGIYHGTSSLIRRGKVPNPTLGERVELAGHWAGHYENSLHNSGAETLQLKENAGQLQGNWSGSAVTGERLGNSTFYLSATEGKKIYRVVGHVSHGELTFDYSAREADDSYFGRSTLKRKD